MTTVIVMWPLVFIGLSVLVFVIVSSVYRCWCHQPCCRSCHECCCGGGGRSEEAPVRVVGPSAVRHIPPTRSGRTADEGGRRRVRRHRRGRSRSPRVRGVVLHQQREGVGSGVTVEIRVGCVTPVTRSKTHQRREGEWEVQPYLNASSSGSSRSSSRSSSGYLHEDDGKDSSRSPQKPAE